jgi:hypothetical protein
VHSPGGLPKQAVAKTYLQYLVKEGVEDLTPPSSPAKVRVHGDSIVWEADDDFESGVGSFVVERNGVEVPCLVENTGSNIRKSSIGGAGDRGKSTPQLAEMRGRLPPQEPDAGVVDSVRTRAMALVWLPSCDRQWRSSERIIPAGSRVDCPLFLQTGVRNGAPIRIYGAVRSIRPFRRSVRLLRG